MTSSPSGLGIVFLGCGQATLMHSRTLRRLGGVDLYYASRDEARARSYCQRFAGVKSFGSYDAGLAEQRVNVAFIATPTVTHRELATLALSAGKHVIIEKPAFMRASDADIVRSDATAGKRHVLVAENYFYKPITEYLRRAIGAGDVGDVRFVLLNATKRQRVNDWRADPALSGGGALFEGGVHWVNFASNIGLEVRDVRAYKVGAATGSDRSSLVILRYANGGICSLAHSWELPAPFGGLRLSKVQGTEGAVTFESNGLLRVTSGRRKSIAIATGDLLGYRAMFADFLSALRTGKPARFSLEMARRDLELLEKAERTMS